MRGCRALAPALRTILLEAASDRHLIAGSPSRAPSVTAALHSRAASRGIQIIRGQIMKTPILARAAVAALTSLALAMPGTAFADIKDYEFQLVQPTVQVGNDRVVTVRL